MSSTIIICVIEHEPYNKMYSLQFYYIDFLPTNVLVRFASVRQVIPDGGKSDSRGILSEFSGKLTIFLLVTHPIRALFRKGFRFNCCHRRK